MNSTVLSLLTGLISGAITAVVTYFATLAKARLDLSIEYDKELRQERRKVYLDLWHRLKPLARYAAEKPVTYQLTKATSESLRDWYFDVGGIYLSRASRGPYFDLKGALQAIIDDPVLAREPDKPLEGPALVRVLNLGHDLRDTLSNDIGTRQQSLI